MVSPIFDEASVSLAIELRQNLPKKDSDFTHEFIVEDFPAEGFPTSPIKGSRGILSRLERVDTLEDQNARIHELQSIGSAFEVDIFCDGSPLIKRI